MQVKMQLKSKKRKFATKTQTFGFPGGGRFG